MTELSYTLDVLVLRVCALAADRAAVIGLCALGRCLINCFTLFVLAEFTHLSIYLFIYLFSHSLFLTRAHTYTCTLSLSVAQLCRV